LHRASFSKSLLNHIKKDYPNLKLCKVWYEIQKPAEEGSNKLYALVNLKNGFILRVTPYYSLVKKWENRYAMAFDVDVNKIKVID